MADRSVNVKLKADVAQYMAAMRAAGSATREIEAAAREVRKAHDEEADAAGRVRLAEAQLKKLRSDSKSTTVQLVQAEEQLASAHRRHETSLERVTVATARFEAAQKNAATEAERSSKKVEDSMSRMAKRTNMQFDAMKFTGLTVGLPAAAAVGAAGVSAALTGAVAGFAALGVAGVAHTDQVRDSFGRLRSTVVDDVRSMSAPLRGDVVGAIDDVGAAWQRMGPTMASAIRSSAPALRDLTGAVTDLAENALPGIATAAKNSLPALEGVRRFSAQAGTGLGEFFANASQGSKGAADGMTILGNTVRTVESRLGSMFGNLAAGSAGPLRSLDVIVDKVTGGLVDLTAQGSGAVGLLQGFSTAGSGAATALGGVLSIVSAIPAPVTQFAGALGAASLIAGKFGIDAGRGFDGLGDKVRAAEGAGAKFKTTMGGLAAGVLSPATAATAGLGAALLIMGQQQERAAVIAAHHANSMQTYTAALRESHGVVDADVRGKVALDLAQKNLGDSGKSILDFARQFGVALPDVTSAVVGQSGALDVVKGALDRYAAANPNAALTVGALKAAIMEKAFSFRDSATATAAEATATDGSTQSHLAQRDAINASTDAIYRQTNASLGYRGAVLNAKAALDEYNKIQKDGKATEDDKARALLGVEQAYMAQAQAAYQAAYANSTSKDEAVRTSQAFTAQNAEIVRLAGTFKGPLPASLQEAIGKMTATQARAAGLTVEIDRTGAAVYRLPDGKTIRINGDNGQALA